MARAINATSDGAGWHMQERKWYVTCRGSKRVPCTSLAECCCMDEKRFWHALMKVWIPKRKVECDMHGFPNRQHARRLAEC